MARSTRRVARKYWPDMKHSEQVRKLSLELFDALQDLHKLGKRERCWLECAAILHDIGLSQGPKAHHKKTLNLILNETQLPFTSVERRVIGNIARYHRKGCPQYKHYNFKSLNPELRRKVTILVGILRLADGLDFSSIYSSKCGSPRGSRERDRSRVGSSEPSSRRVRGKQEKRCVRKIFQKESSGDMETDPTPSATTKSATTDQQPTSTET